MHASQGGACFLGGMRASGGGGFIIVKEFEKDKELSIQTLLTS